MELNEEEKKLVEDNHNLIWYYVRRYGISYDEYYDVLAIELCKAAKHYDESKGTFSTIALKFMNNKMHKLHEESTLQRKIPKDKINNYNSVLDIEYKVGSNYDMEKNIVNKMNLENELHKAFEVITNERDRKIMYYRLKNLTVMEIGEMLNITHQYVSARIKQIRKKLKESNVFQEILV